MLKKIIPLFLSLILFTACSRPTPLPDLQNRTSMPPTEKEKLSITGILETIPLSLYQKGTHQIVTMSGQKTILASPTVNLGIYNGKEVSVKGFFETTIDSAQKVLIVQSIDVESDAAELKEVQNRAFGIRFKYPGSLVLAEKDNRLELSRKGTDIIWIDLYKTSVSLADFIKTREIENGTPITVGGQPALRITEGHKMRIYMSSPDENRVIVLQFLNAIPEEKDQDQTFFYDLLGSLTNTYYKKSTGPVCGGPQNLTCETGFRCELDNGAKDAAGVCIDVNASSGQAVCPFVATPKECQNFQVSGTSAEGCPVSYECLDNKASTIPNSPPTSNVIPSPTEGSNPSSAAPVPVAETETAAPSTETQTPPAAGELTRSYQNSYKNFTINYHKNWYFKSFGVAEGTLWLAGFSDHSLEDITDALITLKILEGSQEDRRSKTAEGIYTFLIPRDTESHFVLEGPTYLQAMIEEMAQSLVIN